MWKFYRLAWKLKLMSNEKYFEYLVAKHYELKAKLKH